jgi:exopolysaccharide production protein ExoQ
MTNRAIGKLIVLLEKAFFILGIIYFTEPFLPFADTTAVTIDPLSGADQSPTIADSSLLLLLRVIILGITLLLSAIRFQSILPLILKRKTLLILMLLFPLSCLWSESADEALRKGIVIVGCFLFGINLAARYSLKEQLLILASAMGLLTVMNLLFTLGAPSAGIEAGQHAGAWRGLYFQKNLLARMMVLSAITLTLASFEHRSKSLLSKSFFYRLGAGLAVLLIVLSTSRSALLTLLLLLLAIPLFRFLRWQQKVVLPALIILFLTSASIATFLVGNVETIVTFLGRDITLTGRTEIWGVVLQKLLTRPWLGYGYQGFWLGMEGDSADVWYETRGFSSPNAHNGFLDMAIELGLVGLALFLWNYCQDYHRTIRWLKLKPNAQGLWPILFFSFILLYNITESTINTPPLIWVLYASITTSILTEPIRFQLSQFANPYPDKAI